MYKFKREKQISFTDFNQPQGMQMNPNNRWVKKAAMIPWDTIEAEYAKLFPSHTGMPAKPLRMALGSLLIQTNSAGDLGAAASLTYQHRNLFKGSESFTIKFRGAYESITGLEDGYDSDNYKEWGVESSLNFPEFKFPFLSSEFKRKIRATSEVGLKFNSQLRPEFTSSFRSF